MICAKITCTFKGQQKKGSNRCAIDEYKWRLIVDIYVCTLPISSELLEENVEKCTYQIRKKYLKILQPPCLFFRTVL